MAKLDIRNFGKSDERRPFVDKGYLDVLRLKGAMVGRAVFEPGWSWKSHVGPIAGTALCEAEHTGYVLSGRMHITTDEGQEGDIGPGDCFTLAPGHDAYVIGDEACVMLDFAGYEEYAKPHATTMGTERVRYEPAPTQQP